LLRNVFSFVKKRVRLPCVANEFIAAGIPASDIMLAFHPANVRPYNGYAIA
jgi:hypothetical protein